MLHAWWRNVPWFVSCYGSSLKGFLGPWHVKAPSMGSTNHVFMKRSSWRSRPGNKRFPVALASLATCADTCDMKPRRTSHSSLEILGFPKPHNLKISEPPHSTCPRPGLSVSEQHVAPAKPGLRCSLTIDILNSLFARVEDVSSSSAQPRIGPAVS